VRLYTVHIRPKTAPVVVREGFSWGALIFGPLWLLAHGAWIGAALDFLAWVLIAAPTRGPANTVLLVALVLLQGVFGHDIRRWSLALRGYALVHVVAARDEDGALARLLAARPELAEGMA
jgi:hypothetical protein